jgi:predicted nucleic acid-binding protein
LLTSPVALHAPALVDQEVLSALRRAERAGADEPALTLRRLAVFDEIVVERHPLPPLRGRVWGLREWLRISDAFYTALAEVLGVPLVTTDLRLARGLRDRGLVPVLTS